MKWIEDVKGIHGSHSKLFPVRTYHYDLGFRGPAPLYVHLGQSEAQDLKERAQEQQKNYSGYY